MKEEHAAEAAGSSSVSVSQASENHTAEAGTATEPQLPSSRQEAEPATGSRPEAEVAEPLGVAAGRPRRGRSPQVVVRRYAASRNRAERSREHHRPPM